MFEPDKAEPTMSETALHGIIPILVTPFADSGEIDEWSLRNLVDFTLAAGVHGLGIALGSEVYKLSESERARVIETVIHQTNGHVPVVVNTGAPGTDLAVFYSRLAEEAGAAAVMCTPPGPGFSQDELLGYFGAIADAVSIPVVIQDTDANPVSGTMIKTIAAHCPGVDYAKVESTPQPDQVRAAVEASAGSVGIIGGAAGTYLLQELRRGAIGTMPWPSTPASFVAVWDRWQAGETEAAHALFAETLAPLLNVPVRSINGGHLVHKHVLHRQGVIRTPNVTVAFFSARSGHTAGTR